MGAPGDGADVDAPPDAAGARTQLRVMACGAVDDGKSTLIGRLLHDCGGVPEDRLAALARDSRRFGTTGDDLDLALLVDGLEDERRQGITIDVAWRCFATPRRAFVLADVPGHEQYTRNVATAASTAEVAVLLVDARHGPTSQTRRHAQLCALFGVRRLVLALNKIDLVDDPAARWADTRAGLAGWSARLGGARVDAVPLSARHGDNVVVRSARTPWYDGPSLLELLESIEPDAEAALHRPFRLAVQYAIRAGDFRGYAGTVASGAVAPGDAVTVAASGRTTTVARVRGPDGDVDSAGAGEAVTVVLAEELDVARGDWLAAPLARPAVADQFAALLAWFGDEPLLPGRSYWLRAGTRWVPASVTTLRHRIDPDVAEPLAARTLATNELGRVDVATATPLAFDAYADDRATGAFVLVDRGTLATVAAGTVLHPLRRATNVHRHAHDVGRAQRERLNGHGACVVWFTGLPASGKSTLANAVERRLHARGVHTTLLDGDNVRHGLNRDLGFTDADRVENVRRVGEVARLFVDAGLVVLCSFVSPFRAERRLVRERLGHGEFCEVHVDTPLEECERRDPKGLYARARAGAIPNFTGVDAPYERPESPELRIDATTADPEAAAEAVIAWLLARGVLR